MVCDLIDNPALPPAVRLRAIADWAEEHGIQPDDIRGLGIHWGSTNVHLSLEAARRIAPGRVVLFERHGENGHATLVVDGVQVELCEPEMSCEVTL